MWCRFLVLFSFVSVLSSCGVLERGTQSLDRSVRNLIDPPETPDVPKPFARQEKTVGTVTMVNAGGQFVLVQTPRGTSLPESVELITFDANERRTARLSLSPEKKGAFYVADIAQGEPGKGDRVVMEGITTENGGIVWGNPSDDLEAPVETDRIQVLE
jgi:hypothetical protein